MAVLQASGLAKAFGTTEIFADLSFQVAEREKVGLVGRNGSGKSTLLRAVVAAAGHRLIGDEALAPEDRVTADRGEIGFAREAAIGWLQQSPGFPHGLTLYDSARAAFADVLALETEAEGLAQEITATAGGNLPPERLEALVSRQAQLHEDFVRAEGYQIESRIRGVLAGLGFAPEDFAQEVGTMSGGERTRAGLARLLLRRPALLLLDEPTNHLDSGATEWLEDFLHDYPGAALIVSHDRYFLDRVVTRVLELARGRLTSYPGNYSDYQFQRDQAEAAQAKAFEQQQAVIAREERFIREARATEKAKKTAHSREKRLAQLERVEAPKRDERHAHVAFHAAHRSGNLVAEAHGLRKAYDGVPVLRDATFRIGYRDRVGLIGPNGAGKTTLLRILVGEEEADGGQLRLGASVTPGYFDQLHQGLDDAKTPFEEITDARRMTNEAARTLLGKYLFGGEEVFKRIGDLSGGERSRVALAKMSLAEANLLILDEPTNHLDVSAVEDLEAALAEFPGTLLIVSHDRYFLDKLCNRIFLLDDGVLRCYDGGYREYLAAREAERTVASHAAAAARAAAAEPVTAQTELDSGGVRPALSKDALARLGKRLSALEQDVEAAEATLKALERQLADPATQADYQEVSRLATDCETARRRYDEVFAEWAQVAEEYEQATAP